MFNQIVCDIWSTCISMERSQTCIYMYISMYCNNTTFQHQSDKKRWMYLLLAHYSTTYFPKSCISEVRLKLFVQICLCIHIKCVYIHVYILCEYVNMWMCVHTVCVGVCISAIFAYVWECSVTRWWGHKGKNHYQYNI